MYEKTFINQKADPTFAKKFEDQTYKKKIFLDHTVDSGQKMQKKDHPKFKEYLGSKNFCPPIFRDRASKTKNSEILRKGSTKAFLFIQCYRAVKSNFVYNFPRAETVKKCFVCGLAPFYIFSSFSSSYDFY